MNVEIIQRTGFFIRSLHNNINDLYRKNHLNTDRETFIVYRGQGLSMISFETMRKTCGSLMSFNDFLSTSRSRQISLNRFALPKAKQPKCVGILLEINIDPEICRPSNIPYADVYEHGAFQNFEEEILFTTHTIFALNRSNKSKFRKSIVSFR